jgi:hypothetical protein
MRQICRVLPILAVLGGLSWGPAQALDCREDAEAEMSRLPLEASQVDSVRFVEKRNPAEKGPEVLGVRAWVRLKSCDGYLVIDMTRSCFVRQSYTRGDCKVEGVTAY